MNKQHIFELWIVLISTKLIFTAPVKMISEKTNVDELLKIVMNSKRFDEIAEKIANKAVEKLKNSGITPIAVQNVNNADGLATYRVSDVVSNETNNFEFQAKPVSKETAVTKPEQYVIGKIDSEAFMKRESMDSLKNLSLKYEHFVGSDGLKSKHRYHDTEDSKEVAPSGDELVEQSMQEDEKQSKHKVSTAEESDDIDNHRSKSELKPDSSTKYYNIGKKKKSRLTTPGDKDFSVKSGEKEKLSDMENTHQEEGYSKKLAHEKHKNEPNEGYSSSESDDIKNNEKKRHSEYKKRAPVYEYLKQADPRQNPASEKEIKDSVETTTLKLRIKEIMLNSKIKRQQKQFSSLTPPRVRKEGNKLYTYQKSPDYEEYHNQISRIQNQLKNNTLNK